MNYLNESNPTLVAVDKVATQRCQELASVNEVGELRHIFQEDLLHKDEISVTLWGQIISRGESFDLPSVKEGKTWGWAASATAWRHPSSWAELRTRCGPSACAAAQGGAKRRDMSRFIFRHFTSALHLHKVGQDNKQHQKSFKNQSSRGFVSRVFTFISDLYSPARRNVICSSDQRVMFQLLPQNMRSDAVCSSLLPEWVQSGSYYRLKMSTKTNSIKRLSSKLQDQTTHTEITMEFICWCAKNDTMRTSNNHSLSPDAPVKLCSCTREDCHITGI